MMKRPVVVGLSIVLAAIGLLPTCTKTDVAFNKFGDRGIWNVTLIDDFSGTLFALPVLRVSNCKPEYDEYCEGTFDHAAGTSTAFKWHFGYSGSYFEMYPVNPEPTEINQAWQQCYNLSGKYDVIKLHSAKFEIESYDTQGYPGKRIFIRMQ